MFKWSEMWPVVLGILSIPVFFLSVYPPEDFVGLQELIALLVVTFLGAWAGGHAAFKAERTAREKDRRNSRVSAANRAIFKIAQAYEMVDNLRRFYVDQGDVRYHPYRAVRMDSPQPGMVGRITFNFDELSFFLDQPGDLSASVLMELMTFEWQFENMRQTIELRAQAREALSVAMDNNPILRLLEESLPVVYETEYTKLDALTSQLIELVDSAPASTREIYTKFQNALHEVFPGRHFLEVNFSEHK